MIWGWYYPRDYNDPIFYGSLLTEKYNGKQEGFFRDSVDFVVGCLSVLDGEFLWITSQQWQQKLTLSKAYVKNFPTPWKNERLEPENHPFQKRNNIFKEHLHDFGFQSLPSLKLTVRPWKYARPQRKQSSSNHPWFQVLCSVSFREGYHLQLVHSFGIDHTDCWWFRNPKQPPGMVYPPEI